MLRPVVGEFVFADQQTIVSHNVLALPRGAYAADPVKHERAVALAGGEAVNDETNKENAQ